MSKKLLSVLALSTSLMGLNSEVSALDVMGGEPIRRGWSVAQSDSERSAAILYGNLQPGSQEHRWWVNFVNRDDKSMTITKYVDSIAATDPKAAFWFLVTGGAHGFSPRVATDIEREQLLSAMGKVVSKFSESKTGVVEGLAGSQQGLEAWANVVANGTGKMHLEHLNNQVRELKDLSGRQEREIIGLRASVESLENRLNDQSRRANALEGSLQQERQRREDSMGTLRQQMTQERERSEASLRQQMTQERERSEASLRQQMTQERERSEERLYKRLEENSAAHVRQILDLRDALETRLDERLSNTVQQLMSRMLEETRRVQREVQDQRERDVEENRAREQRLENEIAARVAAERQIRDAQAEVERRVAQVTAGVGRSVVERDAEIGRLQNQLTSAQLERDRANGVAAASVEMAGWMTDAAQRRALAYVEGVQGISQERDAAAAGVVQPGVPVSGSPR